MGIAVSNGLTRIGRARASGGFSGVVREGIQPDANFFKLIDPENRS
jgi:hypothetical protein